MTVRDLISGSMRLLGILASGEVPQANEANDALQSLNDMLDSWSNESLLVFSKTIESFPLTPTKQTYTMGPSGDFNTTRPQRVYGAGIQQPSTTPPYEIPIDLITIDGWAKIGVKTLQSTLATKLYPDYQFPLVNLNFWPIPTIANTIVIYSWKPFASFASLSTVLSLPPGYQKALRYNLALELAPEYGKPADQAIIVGAMEGKENIKRMNIKNILVQTDPALMSKTKTFNWLTGE